MKNIVLANDSDTLSLCGIEEDGFGVQLRSGATGLGLPPVTVFWNDGAGDGAGFRGVQVNPRDRDLPLWLYDPNGNLRTWASRLARLLSGPAKLVHTADDGSQWYQEVVRTGGGDYNYGTDNTFDVEGKATDLRFVVTVRAGDPFFTRVDPQTVTINTTSPAGLLTGSLMSLSLSSAQNFGPIHFNNEGDAPAFPVWTLTGPFDSFTAQSPSGQQLIWSGATIPAGKQLIIDTTPNVGTCIDSDGNNRYDKLNTRPIMWPIPEGESEGIVLLTNTQPGQSAISVSWHARRRIEV